MPIPVCETDMSTYRPAFRIREFSGSLVDLAVRPYGELPSAEHGVAGVGGEFMSAWSIWAMSTSATASPDDGVQVERQLYVLGEEPFQELGGSSATAWPFMLCGSGLILCLRLKARRLLVSSAALFDETTIWST